MTEFIFLYLSIYLSIETGSKSDSMKKHKVFTVNDFIYNLNYLLTLNVSVF